MTTRSIVYDDQDADNILYSGQWFTNFSAEERIGNFGPPYLHTLHGTKHNASVSFEFDGTEIGVYGSSIVINSQTDPDPNLECFVDGISIGREPIFYAGENNWKLCGKGGFSASPHKLQIDITVQSPEQTFWLDQIRYTPSPSVPLDNKTIMFTNADPAIRLDGDWESLADLNSTSKPNAVAHVDFIGTSVSWVGYIPVELPHRSAFGTYSIDGDNPVNFNLVGLPEAAKDSVYNQVFFTTPDVEKGHHTLTVTFLGSGSTTPLTLDYLYIHNGTLAASSSGTPNSSTAITNAPSATDTATSPTANARGESGLNIGALLGGILGGLVLVVVAGIFLYHRHRRLSKSNMMQPLTGEPGILMPYNSYRDSPTNIGPSIPSPGNRSSAKRREVSRLETRPIKQFHGGSDSAAGPSLRQSSTTGDGVGQAHIDSGIRLNGPPQVEDIPPPRYTVD